VLIEYLSQPISVSEKNATQAPQPQPNAETSTLLVSSKRWRRTL